MNAEQLREKYRVEREKRLRPDATTQYLEPSGKFAALLEDPYTPATPRDTVHDDVEVLLVGAGFAGLVTGARLKQAGVERVRLIDRAGDVGGVWYWNRYPGAMCDTAAMIYLPLLEETGTVPSAKYVPGYEIFEHAQRIARTFNLYDHALFSTNLTSLVWDEEVARWRVTTAEGDAFTAQYVSLGTGPISRPKLPGIPGIETFQGHSFHTSRWDYDYTGGDNRGGEMVGLATQRVGIIGTGATGVQIIPHVGRAAGELFVFQRTPSSVDERNNHPIDPAWFANLKEGWQRDWMANFTTLQAGGFADEDLVKDGWTDISVRIRDRVVALGTERNDFSGKVMREAFELADDEKMEAIRARVDRVVTDTATAERLKPWYRQLCKRPCFHDEYLSTFNRSNVHLVDTDGRGVERIDETGVWVGGEHYELDCLIFASGFEVGNEHSRKSGLRVEGRDGRDLVEYWADGMRTLHGVHVHNFPNLFVVGVAQGANLVSNIPHNFVETAATIASVVSHAREHDVAVVEATAAAEDEWVTLMETAGRSFFGDASCTPGFYNNEGAPMGRREHLNSCGYPAGAMAYFEFMEQWRTSGAFVGLTMHAR